MYCFKKLKFFNVNPNILSIFYVSVVESIWRYCIICWGGNIAQGDKERVERVIKEAGKIIGAPRRDFETVYIYLITRKFADVMEDTEHPLHHRLSKQVNTRSGRMRLPSVKTNRYRLSFVPQAIKIHNLNYNRSIIS